MTVDDVIAGRSRWVIEHGSMLKMLDSLSENSLDSCVTDPPYELGFMNRKWDSTGIAFNPETWHKAYLALKPGAYILAFGGTRTSHRIACAIEDAGFVIRDSIEFAYGSGFPKSMKVGDGLGTALKPAHEPIIVARKPFDTTVAANVLEYGTGGLNIDACRIAHASPDDLADHEAQVKAIKERGGSMGDSWKNSSDLSGASDVSAKGRWPANFLLQHSADCIKLGTSSVKANPTWDTPNREVESTFTGKAVSRVRHADTVTNFAMQAGRPVVDESVTKWQCEPSCPVRLLDQQNKEGASRFFAQFELEDFDFDPFYYCAKPSRAERDMGLDNFDAVTGGEATLRKDGSAGTNSPRAGSGRTGGSKNIHPTVKSLQLMRYLCKLVTPKNGIVLDPFTGSGGTGCAALLEGFRFVGIELNDTESEPFVRIARARIEHIASGEYFRRAAEKPKPAPIVRPGQQKLPGL